MSDKQIVLAIFPDEAAADAGRTDVDVDSQSYPIVNLLNVIMLDKGRIVSDDELKAELASAHPYPQWLSRTQIQVSDLPLAKNKAGKRKLFETAWAGRQPDLPIKTIEEAITLASIVQREGVRGDELPQIARVYLNRLAEPPFILNADPTLQYALGFQSDPPPGTWWKRPLYDTDKQVVSPYNSYQLPGLPPGPIASPGLAAIEAVLAPADGPWMYFVASSACDGTHVFAVTYEEHLANVERYVAAGCGP